jgi:hypothetical protein
MDIGKKTPENGSLQEKESDSENEAEIMQSLDLGTPTDEENAAVPQQNALPFSKARLIALVLTVTGAAFLNVCMNDPMDFHH